MLSQNHELVNDTPSSTSRQCFTNESNSVYKWDQILITILTVLNSKLNRIFFKRNEFSNCHIRIERSYIAIHVSI